MQTVKAESVERHYGTAFLWVTLTLGFLCLLFYGLSFLLARPTVETITTSPPPAYQQQHFDSNNQPMRDAKFHAAAKRH